MGDTIKKVIKKSSLSAFAPGQTDIGKKITKKVNQAIEKPFRKGTSAAARTARNQAAKQQQLETVRLAESEDELSRRQGGALSTRGGRRSLIRSGSGGLATNLGGTSA